MLEGARGYPHMGRKKDGNLRSRRPDWASGFLVPRSGSASDRRGVLDKSLSFSEPQFPTPQKMERTEVSPALTLRRQGKGKEGTESYK